MEEIRFYIKVIDGIAIDHPVAKLNLLQCYETIPSEYEPFNRIKCPESINKELSKMDQSIYTVASGGTEEFPYQKIDGVWTDNWHISKILKRN
jgi:hypothetical protein